MFGAAAAVAAAVVCLAGGAAGGGVIGKAKGYADEFTILADGRIFQYSITVDFLYEDVNQELGQRIQSVSVTITPQWHNDAKTLTCSPSFTGGGGGTQLNFACRNSFGDFEFSSSDIAVNRTTDNYKRRLSLTSADDLFKRTDAIDVPVPLADQAAWGTVQQLKLNLRNFTIDGQEWDELSISEYLSRYSEQTAGARTADELATQSKTNVAITVALWMIFLLAVIGIVLLCLIVFGVGRKA